MDSQILPLPGRVQGAPAPVALPPPTARSVPDFAELLAQILGQAGPGESRRSYPPARTEGRDRPAKPAAENGPEREAEPRTGEPVERPEAELRDESLSEPTAPPERPAPPSRSEKPAPNARSEGRETPLETTGPERPEAPVEEPIGTEPDPGAPVEETISSADETAPVEVGTAAEPAPVASGPFGPAPIVPALDVLAQIFPDATAEPALAADEGPVLPSPQSAAKPETPAATKGPATPGQPAAANSLPIDPLAQPADAPGPARGSQATPVVDPAKHAATEAVREVSSGKPVETAPAPDEGPTLGESKAASSEETLLFESSGEDGGEDGDRSFGSRGPMHPSLEKQGTNPVRNEAAGDARPHFDPREIPLAIQAAARAAQRAQSQPVSNQSGVDATSQAASAARAGEAPQPGSQGLGEAARNAQASERATSNPAARPDQPASQAQAEAIERIVRMARVTRLGERSTARVWLRPPELGTVRVTVTVERGVVSANLSVETAAAREALASELPQLSQLLEEQGMKLGRIDVGFFGGETGRQADRDLDKELRDRGSERRSGEAREGLGKDRSRDDDDEPEPRRVGHIGLDSVDLLV